MAMAGETMLSFCELQAHGLLADRVHDDGTSWYIVSCYPVNSYVAEWWRNSRLVAWQSDYGCH